MKIEGKKNKSKAELAKEEVFAVLDAADIEVPSNPGQDFTAGENEESFQNLYEGFAESNTFLVGDVVKGKVIEVQEDFVLIDINYKSEGLVPISEFRLVEGKTIEVGSEVEVCIDRIENENGMVVLSKDKADMMRTWNEISQAAESESIIDGTIIAKVKGGLSVDIGVKAFLPGSQIDLRPVRNMDIYVGKTYKFKVIKFNKRRGNIVLSRRELLEKERDSLRSQTLKNMKEGSLFKGIVKNITEYGAFIDLGGMDGLLHITDMSWGRIKHPSEILNVGDDIEVKVLKFDDSKGRVSLGLKQLTEDPWKNVLENYPKGRKMEGKVVSLADYRAFVTLDEGIEGLIHISEMSWTKRVKHPSQIMNVDDIVKVIVLDIDSDNRRISLGMKQLEENPWLELKKTYPPGVIVEGEVKSLTDFGAFVGIKEGIDGLIHISDFSWNKRVEHPSEMVQKGDKIKAVVLGLDIENERISLGVKQLESDPWSVIEDSFPIGSQQEVEVTECTDFGVFVKLNEYINGLIHISELSTKRVEKADEICKVGDKIKAEILTIDKNSRKINLSAKLVTLREQKANVDDYVKKATTTSKTSLGDIFGNTLKDANVNSEDNE